MEVQDVSSLALKIVSEAEMTLATAQSRISFAFLFEIEGTA